MRKTILLLLTGLLFVMPVLAQFSENFSDGDFTANPAWEGGTADWVVNASQQLQSNNTVANSSYYLSTPSTLATVAQWEFLAQLNFNTSSANYMDVFLIASAADLTQTATSGYFVRMGGTDDEISLFRKDGATLVKIIDGADGSLNQSASTIKIKVTRNAANQWQLNRTINAAAPATEGVITDATYNSSASFGVFVKQSTASFFQKHFIDDIILSNYVPDVTAPDVLSYTIINANSLDLLFNEPLEEISTETIANYSVSNGVGFPATAVLDAANNQLVHLNFSTALPARTNLTITINGVKDLSDNATNNLVVPFVYSVPLAFDVLIDEIMADPTPLNGLPDAEWIELRNRSAFEVNLQNWKIGKPSGLSGSMPSYILKPDSFVIVCTGSAVAALSVFGPVISVTSFPSLSNTGDLLYLQDASGNTIHTVNYTDAWYQNELKKDGGWTLEMTDTQNPCAGASNWRASTDPSGGTPGRKNSNDASNPDDTSPKLLRAYAPDSVHITLVFDEPLNAVSAALTTGYTVSDGIGNPITAIAISPLFDRVSLELATALQRNRIYTVTVNTLSDCVNNGIGTSNTARVGLYEHTDSLDMVVNEVLFNPSTTSNDYVEIYNRSNKILNLRQAYLANLNTSGVISSITQLSAEDYLLFPGDFMVATDNADLVKATYITQNPDAFIQITMPSFNDDEGNVILLNEQGNIVDQLAYKDDWHFKLISNEEGVSLERIDYNAPTQQEQNWHSAASSAGYGTPTYKNSQFRVDASVQGEIKTEPEIVSPDNDGRDDFASILYSFPEPGYVANITVFDAVGRTVRVLQRNALCGIKGSYRWDGLGDKNQQLPSGIYIVYTEVFNLSGKTKKFKNSIVLARKK
jgi:hypothetical protein